MEHSGVWGILNEYYTEGNEEAYGACEQAATYTNKELQEKSGVKDVMREYMSEKEESHGEGKGSQWGRPSVLLAS